MLSELRYEHRRSRSRTNIAGVVGNAELVAADPVDANLWLLFVPEWAGGKAGSELPDGGNDVFVAAFRDAALVVEDGKYTAEKRVERGVGQLGWGRSWQVVTREGRKCCS
jgi:hypothetical protein